ncbi:TetR/AcrR family transcriptional regulator [Actinomadura flavalba]|uniref:TetR/AcrR family transcriptional regulator n=1 Tax=Actinomadura flavalba TaxID=1120938 RepID=UPI000525A613|nr:TetR/AcrR family transcriptional regulator [Actinomadura flavalba]
MSDDQEAGERVTEVATRLFAELGYDGTPMQLIADTLGMPIAEVTRLTGGKQQLYLAVMRRAAEAEDRMLTSATDGYGATIESAYEVVDAVLDFYVAHPEYRALWMHRWLSDATDVEDLESQYVLTQSVDVIDRVRENIPDEVDPVLLVGTVIWTVFGFLSGGRPTPEQPTRHEPTPDEIDHFRRYLHAFVRRMLAPSG